MSNISLSKRYIVRSKRMDDGNRFHAVVEFENYDEAVEYADAVQHSLKIEVEILEDLTERAPTPDDLPKFH